MLRRLVWLLCLFPSLLLAQNRLSGEWLVTDEVEDVRYYHDLSLVEENSKLAGKYNGESIQGTVSGNAVHFVTTDKKGKTTEYAGTLSVDGTLSFQAVNPTGESKYTARRIPERRSGPPQQFEFTPTTYYRRYSALTPPVLRVWPGDTIHTSTVDSGGTDGNGVDGRPGGNPLTGPFYIETAMPGDVLAIHFNRIRLNRDEAVTSGQLVPRVLGPGLAAALQAQAQSHIAPLWHLDREHGVATLKTPTDHLKDFSVPVRPMMGCVGVAPRGAASPAGDSGAFGGNMDVNELVEGTTLYLPVFEPGALLYMGDAHALMGDGEITGSGLETSMDVEFTVDIVNKPIFGPTVESDTHIITVGLGGSLEDAIQSATSGLVRWLQIEYKLTIPEAIQVLGSAVEYSVGEVADRNAGVLAKINKKYLAELRQEKSSSVITPASSQATRVISVWGGAREAIALKSDGTVWTWGHNGAGQLGNGTEIYEPTPVQVLGKNGAGTLNSVIAIAGGEIHNVAVTSDGNVWQWGGLGNGRSKYPVQVQGLSSVTAVASRAYATLAVKSDGTVWGWGMNCHNVLGSENPKVVTAPVQIKGLKNPIMVSAGYCFGLALLQDHTVVAWGNSKELGNGSKADSDTPVPISGLANVATISAGWTHAMAVKSDGTVWTWGENHWGGAYRGDGKLGNGTTAEQLIPTKVPGLTNVIQASGGDDFSAVLKSDGTVWTFGANGAGQLGNGDPKLEQQLLPVQVISLKNITYITARDFHAQAIQSDGTVWSWGSGVQGELGVPCKALSVAEQAELTGTGDRSPQPPNCINSNVPVKVQWP